ncbi:THAP domain-containing protein 7-like isoform X1 [Ornithodoros turicata]|uniref:THAP domain-containing protein 7-like isoform X1 n=1 Tax=Ornithodoros turicata TaxID=34597 RepID=UPI003139D7A6
MPAHCSVPLCKQRGTRDKNNEKVSFHRIPKQGDRYKKWIAAIKRDEGKHFKVSRSTVVCSKHFKDSDFLPNIASGQRILRDDAVPSLFAYRRALRARKPPKGRARVRRKAPQSNRNGGKRLSGRSSVSASQAGPAGTSSLLAYLQDHIYAQPSSPALSKNGLPVSSPAADDGLEARSVGTQIYPIRCFKSTQTSEASRLMLLLDREPTPLAGLFAGRVKHESVSVPNGQPASSTADASIEARSVGTQIYPLRCSKSTQTSEASRLMLLLDRENPQHVLWSHREPLLESCGHNAGSS